MRALRWLLVLCMAAGAPAMLSAQQTGVVRGTIVDATTERPMQQVQVSVAGTGRGSLTDAAGRFMITNVPVGSHTLRAQIIGYTEFEQQITVAAGQVTSVSVRLEPTAIALQGVVVTGVSGGAQERAKVPFTVTRIGS